MTMSVAPLPAPFKKLGAWAETLDAEKVLFGWDVGWTQRLADGAPLASARGSPAAPLPRGEAAGGEFLVQTPHLIGGIAIRLTVQNDRGRDVSMVLASGVAIELSGAYYADVDALNSTSTPTKSSFFVATPLIRSIALISWA